MRQLIEGLVLGLLLVLGPVGSVRGADDPFSADALRGIERAITANLAAYGGCQSFPCPDVDCPAFAAVSDALWQLHGLLGTTQRVAVERTLGDYEARERTLGYWLERENLAAQAVYADVTDQVRRDLTRQAFVESVAEYQRALINWSKLSQLFADFMSFNDLVKSGESMTTLGSVMAAGEVLNTVSAAVDSASFLIQAGQGLQGKSGGEPIPQSLADAMTVAGTVKEGLYGGIDLTAAQRAQSTAKAQFLRILELRSALLPEGAERAAALAARNRELAALQKSAESNAKLAGEAARKAAASGAMLVTKLLTVKADAMQKEMRDFIDELRRNVRAEERTMLDRGAELIAHEDRRQALRSLRARIQDALAMLAACHKTCGVQMPARSPEVPVRTFTFQTTDAAGKTVTRESYGKALAWFAPVLARTAAAITTFRIEDGKVRLTPEPQRVGTGVEIKVRVEGPRCLMRRGKVSGDGETRQTALGEPLLIFGAKQKAGDYTYTYEPPTDLPPQENYRYLTSTVVTVGTGGILGYWQRSSAAMIIDGRGQQVEWQTAPKGVVVSESDDGRAVMAFLPPGPVQLGQAFSSPNLNCARDNDRLQCRFEAETGCGGQWYEFEIAADGDKSARFKVGGGELTNAGPDGCMRFPHSFAPLDFSLARDPPGAELETAFPCPTGYRCR